MTGMGALTPIGNNVPDYWASLLQGVSGSAHVTRFDVSKFKTRFACELKDFDPAARFDRKEVKKYDLFTQYALIAVEEAVKHANIRFENLDRNRIGVIWGSGNGGIGTFQEQVSSFAKGIGEPRFSPYFIPRMIVDIASGVISIRYGLRGVNFTTVSACATSNTAILEAFNHIRWGKADMIITGGSEAALVESVFGGFGAAKSLSTRNESPETASRPFDTGRDGFVMGEGAGALILESLESALKRNAPILAEIAGGGMAADAYHLTATHPEGEGAYLGMRQALAEAGIEPADIDYINAHATSTPTGDDSELRAIERVFGIRPGLTISSTKSMTGHLLGAAGAVEAIACIQSVQEDAIPPTINTRQVEPDFADKFDFTLEAAQRKPVQYAMSNTFGFGGHVAISIFRKWTG